MPPKKSQKKNKSDEVSVAATIPDLPVVTVSQPSSSSNPVSKALLEKLDELSRRSWESTVSTHLSPPISFYLLTLLDLIRDYKMSMYMTLYRSKGYSKNNFNQERPREHPSRRSS
jgi:hypothetical protein